MDRKRDILMQWTSRDKSRKTQERNVRSLARSFDFPNAEANRSIAMWDIDSFVEYSQTRAMISYGDCTPQIAD